jgi:prevent-host-death family protein
MKLTRDIQSLSEFKRNTTKFLKQMQKTKEPVVLTVNGKATLVVQDAESYEELMMIKERMETIAGIKRGLESMKRGEGQSLEEFAAEFRQKHNFTAEEEEDEISSSSRKAS